MLPFAQVEERDNRNRNLRFELAVRLYLLNKKG